MVFRCACRFGIIVNLIFVTFFRLLNLAIFVLKYYGQCLFKGKHIFGGIVFYKHNFLVMFDFGVSQMRYKTPMQAEHIFVIIVGAASELRAKFLADHHENMPT